MRTLTLMLFIALTLPAWAADCAHGELRCNWNPYAEYYFLHECDDESWSTMESYEYKKDGEEYVLDENGDKITLNRKQSRTACLTEKKALEELL